jgi:Membrane protein involved in the export of O-antigen and teichoic acid
MLPISSINAAIGTYLFPKYSAMQDKLSEVRFSYLRVMKLTFFSLAPLVIIFSQTVHVFVDLIWGDAWAEAIPTIQVLCALAILGCFVAPSGQLMKSFGRPDWLLYWSIFTILLSAILLFLGIKIAGLIGASLALLLSCVLSLPVVMLIIKQLIGVDFRKIIKLIGPIAIASISMLATFLVSKIQGYDGLLSLSITTFAALAIYLIVMVWFDKSAQNTAKLFCSGERRIVHLVRLFANHPY